MKDFKIYIIAASVLLAIYLVAEYNKPNPEDWRPTLYYGDKIPLGTYVLYNQLGDIFPDSKVVKTDTPLYDAFNKLDSAGGTYLVFAKQVKVSKQDFGQMVKYMQKGNSVFLATFSFDGFLGDTLNISRDLEFQTEKVSVNFTSNSLKQDKGYQFDREINNAYFNSFDTAKAVVVAKNNLGHAVMLRFKFGKGSLFLCAAPTMFSNYAILSGGDSFAAKALSFLPATANVYWDEYQNGDIPVDRSLLRVIFANPSLKWAYYLGLWGLLIFVFYQVKRRQRIIPVIEPLTNATVDFVNVVAQVYFEQRNNTDLARKKVTYLLEHLRDEYFLKTSKLDEEFATQMAQKLNIEPEFATELVNFMAYIENQPNITDADLVKLNNLTEKLNKQIA